MSAQFDFSRWLAGLRRATELLDARQFLQGRSQPCQPDMVRLEKLRDHFEQQAHFRMLMELTCADVMRSPVTSVTGDQRIEDALALLDRRRIKLLPVVKAGNRLIGVVTRVDLDPMGHIGHGSRSDRAAREWRLSPVRSVLSTAVVTVAATTLVADVLPLFTSKGHHHLPVVLDDDEVIGMLTQSDIVGIMCSNRVP